MEEIKLKIRGFLKRFLRNRTIEDDENMFESGFVNSLFSMQLVMFLEKEFQIRFDSADLDLDNFKSINDIARLISKKNELNPSERV